MEALRCFICGIRIGKGNHPSVHMHERMEKLISVSQTVEHSSTIISDILSRILNETVMREETICRICFNLLNDIDYHLKEAQEKTDEITNKFLDKEKDPLSYRPQPIVSAEKDVNETTELSLSPRKQNITHNKENINDVTRTSKRHHTSTSKRKVKTSSTFVSNDTDSTLTEDEMSVNMINRNKAKLLSHVLNPSKKLRKVEFKDSEDDEEEDEEDDKEEEVAVVVESKTNRHHKKAGSRNKKHSKSSRAKRRPLISATTSDDEEEDETSKSKQSKPVQKPELTTVNMDDLKDMFTKPKVYFAKKSTPEGSKEKQNDVDQGLSRSSKHSEQAPPAPADLGRVDKFPVSCEICFKTFKLGTNLQLHKEKVHNIHVQPVISNIPETHKCSVCPREFTNLKSLNAHEMEHEGISDEDAAIEKKPAASSKAKETAATSGEAKATCPICSKTFRRHFNMRTHVNRVHEKVKPFVCSICEKSFATNSDLKQHMVVHGQGKMFTCETCGREFGNRDSIILHRKQHTQQHTHFCQICNKGFYKASCLNRHLRSHTGERPYKCEGCKKGFSQSTTLKAHVVKCNQIYKDSDEDEDEVLS